MDATHDTKAKIERMDWTMKRKFLEDLGLEKDVIDKILDENSADIGKAKADLEAVTSERDKLKNDLVDRDKQLEGLKNSTGDLEGMKKKIADLQAENKTKDQAHAAELKQLKIESAVSAALSAAKAKNVKAVKALLDLDPEKVEILEDGTIKGLDKQIKSLQEGEDSKFMFGSGQTFVGVKPGEGSGGQPTGVTKEQFNKMSYKDRVNLYNTDKATYDALAGKE